MQAHNRHLYHALALARECEPTSTAYNVGCVITKELGQGLSSVVVSEGYSRELLGNTHAEQCALEKLSDIPLSDISDSYTLYSTMEPCSERLSGQTPCAQRIISFGRITSVIIAVREPDTFVDCIGVEQLQRAGITVAFSDDIDLQSQCLEVAKVGHKKVETCNGFSKVTSE